MNRFRSSAAQPDDEAILDDALERMVRGDTSGLDRLDPEMRATVRQMFQWADESGLRTRRPPSTPQSSRPIRLRVAPALSTIAAVLVIGLIGLAGYLTLSLYPTDDAAPTPSIPAFAASAFAPLTAADCAREPRTEDEVLSILRAPARSDPSAPPMADAIGASPEASVPTAEEVRPQIDATLRGWVACHQFGDAYGAMAYESEDYIRRATLGAADLSVTSTITDAQLLERAGQSGIRPPDYMTTGEQVSDYIYVVESVISVGVEYSSPTVREVQANLVAVAPETGERLDEEATAFFVMEDGEWRLDQFIPGETTHSTEIGARIELGDIYFAPTELTVAIGDTIHLVNGGQAHHTFIIEGYNDNNPIDLPIGGVVWIVPDDLAPGTYTFYCGVAGHREAGMTGTITITE